MIHKLTIKDPTKTPMPWLGKVNALKALREFAFKPGLNVLWGLARLLHCEQGGRPLVTQESLSDLVGGSFDDVDIKAGVKLVVSADSDLEWRGAQARRSGSRASLNEIAAGGSRSIRRQTPQVQSSHKVA